jgi:integrase
MYACRLVMRIYPPGQRKRGLVLPGFVGRRYALSPATRGRKPPRRGAACKVCAARSRASGWSRFLPPGALVHGLRHTYATELAGADVSVYTLMNLLGHESMTTSQRYVTAAGPETRSAAARNGLYALIPGCANDADLEIWLDRDP